MNLATRIPQSVLHCLGHLPRVQQLLNAAPFAYSTSDVTTGWPSAPACSYYEDVNKYRSTAPFSPVLIVKFRWCTWLQYTHIYIYAGRCIVREGAAVNTSRWAAKYEQCITSVFLGVPSGDKHAAHSWNNSTLAARFTRVRIRCVHDTVAITCPSASHPWAMTAEYEEYELPEASAPAVITTTDAGATAKLYCLLYVLWCVRCTRRQKDTYIHAYIYASAHVPISTTPSLVHQQRVSVVEPRASGCTSPWNNDFIE